MIKQIINSTKHKSTQSRFWITPEFKPGYLGQVLLLSFTLTMAGCLSETEDDPTSTNTDTTATTQQQLAAFQENLYPILTNHCSGCHTSQGSINAPDFAHETVATAFSVVNDDALVNLSNSAASPVVTKLILEFHACGSECLAWAEEIRLGIEAWIAAVSDTGSGGTGGGGTGGGDTGGGTDPTPDPTPDEQLAAFQTNLYPVLTNRCGRCHDTAGLDSIPDFANDTVMTAFNTVNADTLVNINSASNSILVTKLTVDLHRCGTECQAWAAEIRLGIEAWAVAVGITTGGGDTGGGDTGGGGSDPTPSPDEQLSAFQTNLYPILTNRCGTCHASQGPGGTPDFAHETVSTAFDIVSADTLANLNNTANSRLVTKLTLELHRCGSECQAWANEIRMGIEAWSAAVGGTVDGGINGTNIASSTLKLSDGAENAGSGRIETDVIAKYEFKAGSGTTAFDTSGVAPALNLTFGGDVSWIAGQGIDIADSNNTGVSKAVATQADSKKLYDMIAGPQGTQEYTIEAWIHNENLADTGPARIVSYSATSSTRNFTMGQQTSYYNFRNRSNLSSTNGTPALESDNNAGDLKTELQHVVMTFDTTNGRNIYVNGTKVAYQAADAGAATIANDWNPDYTFILGNEAPDGTDRQWKGKMFFVAIHKRALSAAEVLTNATAGIGTIVSLEFDVSTLLDPTGVTVSKIRMGVSELDAFSYVFGEPVLTTDITAPNIPVKNIRIAVNGNVPAAAQAFKNVDMTVTSSPTELSRLGSVIQKDTGPDNDQFTLLFEVLGNNQNIVVEPAPSVEVDLSVNDPSPERGLRTFEQINNTMSNLTGVDTGVTSATFNDLHQQLPGEPSLGSFVSAHQVGIAKLALEYCDALVESNSLRTAFFGGTFEFNSAVSTAFSNQTKQNIITSNLVNKMVGTNLSSQPSLAEIQPDLDQLIGELTVGCNVAADCNSARTRTVVKAACAAVLGSAAVTIQ